MFSTSENDDTVSLSQVGNFINDIESNFGLKFLKKKKPAPLELITKINVFPKISTPFVSQEEAIEIASRDQIEIEISTKKIIPFQIIFII